MNNGCEVRAALGKACENVARFRGHGSRFCRFYFWPGRTGERCGILNGMGQGCIGVWCRS